MGAIAFFGKVVAEHVFVEVAHRVHFENHLLSVDENAIVDVECLGRFVVLEVSIDHGLLPGGELS